MSMREIKDKLERLLKSRNSAEERGQIAISFATKALTAILRDLGYGSSPELLDQTFAELLRVEDRAFCYPNGGGKIARFKKCYGKTLLLFQPRKSLIPESNLKAGVTGPDTSGLALHSEYAFGYDSGNEVQMVLGVATEDDLSCTVLHVMLYDYFSGELVDSMVYYAKQLWDTEIYEEFNLFELLTEAYYDVLRKNFRHA